MKRKSIVLAAIVMLLGLTACSNQPDNNNDIIQDGSGSAAVSEQQTIVSDIKFDYKQENGEEFASVTASNKNGNTVWTYTTEKYLTTELTQVQELGQTEEYYYLNESGTILALDKNTGNIVWSNNDFGGASASAFIDEDGTLYCCGYYGPDFCAIDSDGSTLKIIDSFDNNYIWASDIRREGDYIAVTMEGTPIEDEQGEYVFHVDPKDFSYSLYR